MRVFIALELPAAVREALGSVQAALRRRGLFSRSYTGLDDLHLTLKFLGELSDSEIAWVRERLRGVEAGHEARLREAGTFGDRIVWVRLEGADALQSAVDDALAPRFSPEERFMGHITIARPKNLARDAPLAASVRELSVPPASFPIKGLALLSSELTPTGPIYHVIERFSWGSDPADG